MDTGMSNAEIRGTLRSSFGIARVSFQNYWFMLEQAALDVWARVYAGDPLRLGVQGGIDLHGSSQQQAVNIISLGTVVATIHARLSVLIVIESKCPVSKTRPKLIPCGLDMKNWQN